MAAANTDLLRKKESNFSTTISSGITAGATSVPLSSVSGLPTDTAITLTFDRVDANGTSTPSLVERITGVISGTNLTSCLRGQDGTTGQSHSSGAVVEDVWDSDTWNDLIDALLVGHAQDGAHNFTTVEDSNGNESLKLSGVASAVNEITVENAATGNNPKILATGEADTGITFENSEDEEILVLDAIATAVNELKISNAATGNNPAIAAQGDDTDVGIDLTPQGAGKVNITANDFNLATGANVQVNGSDPWRTVYWGAGVFKPTTTAGCAAVATVEAGTNDIDYDVLDFDKDTDENAFANLQMPDSWDGGVIQFRFIWTASGGGSAETVAMVLSGGALANDDAIDQALGTGVEVDDTWIADGDIHISAWSGDITLAGSPAGGQYVHLNLLRDVSEDDLGVDARILGIQVRFKQAQYTD